MSAWFPPYRWDDDPTKRALRKRIHRANIICLDRASHCRSDDAGALFLQATHMAASWLYARASEEILADVVALLTLLWNAAEELERMEAGDGA